MSKYVRLNNHDCSNWFHFFLETKGLFDKNGQLISRRDFIMTYIWKPKAEITLDLLESYYVRVQYSQIMPFKEYLENKQDVTYDINIIKYIKKEFICTE